jgi:hypothetical protein
MYYLWGIPVTGWALTVSQQTGISKSKPVPRDIKRSEFLSSPDPSRKAEGHKGNSGPVVWIIGGITCRQCGQG